MARIAKIAAVAAGVLLLLVAAAVATLAFVDWSVVREPAQKFLSGAAGRDVRIGRLDVEPGWTTRIALREVEVGNAEWGEEPHLASIEELFVSVRLWPVLRGRVDLPEVILRRPVFAAEKDAEGRVNWETARPAEAAGEAVTPDERSEFPLVGQLVIDGGRMKYRDDSRGVALEGTVSTATGEADRRLELALEGSLEKKPVKLSFEGGSLTHLRDSEEPYPFRVELDVGGTRVRAEGTAKEPVQLRGFDMRLAVSGPSLAEVFPVFGIPLPATGPYSLDGRLGREGEKWRFEDFTGKVGESDLNGWLVVDYESEVPVLRADLVSRKLDLAELSGLIGAKSADEDKAKKRGVFPNTPLVPERLTAMDMDVRFRGERVDAPLPVDRLDMRIAIRQGLLSVDPLAFGVGGGTVAGSVRLDARGEVPAASAAMTASEIDLKPFFKDSKFVQEMGGRFLGRLDVKSAGRSVADLMNAMDGSILVAMRDGSVSALLVEAAGLDVAEALALAVGGDKPVAIRCGLIDGRATDGVVRIRRGWVDTADSLLVLQGAADLGGQTFDIQLRAHEKDFSLIDAAAPIRVWGPFAGPRIRIGGFDPLPFLEMGGTKDIDCASLLEEASKRVPSQQRKP